MKWPVLASLTLLFVIPVTSWAQKKRTQDKNVIVRYKKYQSFDLSGLQIKGRILAPGDLTINDRGRRGTDYPLFDRKHFRQEMLRDIDDIR